jgi:hypothetical protein
VRHQQEGKRSQADVKLKIKIKIEQRKEISKPNKTTQIEQLSF